jgi:hypothetical protein
MTVNLPEGTGNLYLKESAHALRLDEAYAGARITLTVDVASNIDAHAISVQMTADLVAGKEMHNHQYLCAVTADRLVTPYKTSTTVSFIGTVTLDALRALEEKREGGPLQFVLRNVRAVMVGTTEQRLLEGASGGVSVTVPASTWAEHYERVTSATSFSLLVPTGDDKDIAEAVRHLNAAREQLRRGTVGSGTAAEIRLALGPVRTAYGTTANTEGIRTLRPRDRSLQQRWAVSVEDQYSYLSSFIHNDEEQIEDAVFTRPLANAAIQQVAGMLSRLAAERSAGLI